MVIINLAGDNLLQPFPQVMVIALMSGFGQGKGQGDFVRVKKMVLVR